MGTLRTSYSFPFRLGHGVLLLCLSFMVLTGFGLHTIARPDWSLTDGNYPSWMVSGRLGLYHIAVGILVFAALAMVLPCYLKRPHDGGGNRWRRGINIALLSGCVLSLVSAPALLHPGGPPAYHLTLRVVHGIAGLVILPLAFLGHLTLALTRYRTMILPVLHPWAGARLRYLPIPFAAVAVAAACYLNRVPWVKDLETLPVTYRESVQDDIRRLPWEKAPVLRMTLSNGVGFKGGQTAVALQGFYDDRDLVMKISWDDPREDKVYMPWTRTADGWKQSEPAHDIRIYYEDKFSLYFPTKQDPTFDAVGCALYCHQQGGKCYGFKASGAVVDVWHWKGMRTQVTGYVDDQYVAANDPTREEAGRYPDPTADGKPPYVKNLIADEHLPRWLPKAPQAVYEGVIYETMRNNPGKTAAYGGQLAMMTPSAGKFQSTEKTATDIPSFALAAISTIRNEDESLLQECTPEAGARFPIGSIIPGIVVKGPPTGDRGDVCSLAVHDQGKWTLYVRRALVTGSPYDVQFTRGNSYSFAAAAFDHCSKRHAYNYQAYAMTFLP